MNLLEKLRKKDILSSYVIAFFLVLIVTFAVISLGFQRNVTTEIEKTILMDIHSEADETAGCFKNLFSDLYDFSTRLQSISDLAPQPFHLNPYQASQSIANFDFSFTHYSDMVIFYPNESNLLTLYGIEKKELFFKHLSNAVMLMDTISSCKKATILSTQNYGASQGSNQLILVQPLPLTSTNPQYYVLFFFNNSMINNLLGRGGTQSAKYCILRGMDNGVLWANVALGEEQLITLTEPSISAIEIDNESYFVTQHLICQCMKMTILLPAANRYTPLNESYRRYYSLCTLIFLTVFLCFFFCIRRGYYPLKKVLTSYNTEYLQNSNQSEAKLLTHLYNGFEEAIKNQDNFQMTDTQLCDFYVLSCIRGYQLDRKTLAKLQEKASLRYEWRRKFVILMLFKDPSCWRNKGFYINADMGFQVTYSTPLGNSTIIGIVQHSDATEPALSRKTIVNFLFHQASNYGKVTFAIGLDSINNDISHSYMEAALALEYRFIKGCNTTIYYEEVQHIDATQSAFPFAMLQKYHFALSTWDNEQIQQSLQDLLAYISSNNISLQQAKFIGLEISSSLFYAAQNLPSSTKIALDAISISEYSSLEELVSNISKTILEILNGMKLEPPNVDTEIVEQCRKMIREHYSDAQFSLTDISDALTVTPQTLRKKYKALTGHTLSDDLKTVRIERAKTLLIETDKNISDIVQDIGYLDSSSFVKLFKNYTGLTPGQYRIKNRIQQNTNLDV